MKTSIRTFILAVFFAAGTVQAQSPVISFEDLMYLSEENPRMIKQAAGLAMASNLPVSVYTADNIFIQALGVENGMPVYAVIRNIARPYDNGTTAFYDEFKNQIDFKTSKVNYGNGKIINPDLGVKKNIKKTHGVIEKSIMFVEITNDCVWILDYQTGEVIENNYISGAGTLSTPIQARKHPSGNITISEQVNDGVFKFDTSGAYLGVFAPFGGVNTDTLDNVRGHIYRTNGNLLVANAKTGVNTITQFNSNGIFLNHFISPGAGGLDSPWDILFRSADVLVSASSSDAIHRYDTSGNYLDNFYTSTSTAYFPEQMILMSDGRIAVADFGVGGGVSIYSSAGDTIKTLDVVTGVRRLFQLPDGHFITSNAAGAFKIDSANGVILDTLAGGVNGRFFSLYEREGASYPILVKDKNNIDFGITAFGNPVYDTVSITNTGDVSLIIDTIYISDPLNFDFTHSIDTIPPGESRNVYLMFDPSEYGIHEDALVFIHNAQSSPDSVYLKGSVFNAKIALSDTVLTGMVNENGRDSTAFRIYNQGMTGLTYSISESENAFTFLKKQKKSETGITVNQGTAGPLSLAVDPLSATGAPLTVIEGFGDLTAFGFNMKTSPDQFVRFDLTEPSNVFTKGTVPQSIYAADFSTDGSVYYAVDDVSKQFGTIDTATGAFTVRGSLTGVTGYVTGMTVDPTDETIYITVTDGSSAGFLYTVNSSNGSATLVDTMTNLVIPIDIAASPYGILYSYDITTDSLYVIDKATAFGTAVASLDFNTNYAQGMDFDPADGILYLASYTSTTGVLRTLDLNTGVSTIIGTFPNHQIDGFGILKTGLPWVYAQPTSGTILPGDSADIKVYWYGKIPGEMIVPLDGYFHIASDDTASPNVSVRLHLGVVISADNDEKSPVRYSLAQNYPNPFNPSTTIRYDLAKSGKVILKIYNTLGQEVRTLVRGYQSAGNQSVIWDGKNNNGKAVSSGIYFYRLEAESFLKTMKMLLVR